MQGDENKRLKRRKEANEKTCNSIIHNMSSMLTNSIILLFIDKRFTNDIGMDP